MLNVGQSPSAVTSSPKTITALDATVPPRRIANEEAFAAFLRILFQEEWVVYAKAPFGGPEHVLQYLAPVQGSAQEKRERRQNRSAGEHERRHDRWHRIGPEPRI
jgi:hypothetical protein